VVPNRSSTSPLEEISDILDYLSLHACVELTRRLLISISSFPTGAARPRAVLKPSFSLWPNMAADTLETQFQPVADPSVPAVIEMVDEALRSYFQTPASEPKLTKPDELYKAIRGLMVGKAPGQNGIQNRALEYLPQRAVSQLVRIFYAILLTHHFPSLWKHARVTSNLKPVKDPALPSSYRTH